MTQERIDEQYRIHLNRMPWFHEKMDALVRRAKRIGCPEPEFEILGTEQEERGGGLVDEYVMVQVTGEAPQFDGWFFVAEIEHEGATGISPEEGNIVRVMPGRELPVEYRTAGSDCDHCGVNRYRKHTFVVVHDDEGYRQVGSTCVRDFLGHASPASIARWAELFIELGEVGDEAESYDPDMGPREPTYLNTAKFLEFVSASIRAFGWMSKSKSTWEEPPTSELAMSFMFMTPRQQLKANANAVPQERDEKKAEAALKWARKNAESLAAGSDFWWNLHVLLGTEESPAHVFRPKDAGYVAALLPIYDREMERLRSNGHSEYIGTPGDKLVLDRVTLVAAIPMGESPYDGRPRFLYKFEDDDGNVIVWWTHDRELAVDTVFSGSCKVKEHKPFRDIKQTVVTHFSLKPMEEGDE